MNVKCQYRAPSSPDSIHGKVNGIRLDRSSLLTLGDRQRVPGVTRVTHVGGKCLEVADLTTPFLNGVDLDRLINHAVRTVKEDGMREWTFECFISRIAYIY